jgi:hypothetical protein
MNIEKRCELCDTVLEFEHNGTRLAFTAHDAAFCAGSVRARVQSLTDTLTQAARDRAEVEASLRRRIFRLEVEVEVLRDMVHEAANAIPDEAERAVARRRIEDPRLWEAWVARRIEARRQREIVRGIEIRRLLAGMTNDESERRKPEEGTDEEPK